METEKSFRNFTPTGRCPVRDVLSRLGDKWSMLVLLTLHANGVMRFSEIHRTLGDISHRMLTVTLRTLETDGMLRRKVYAEVPPRVEYDLTRREPASAYFRTGGVGAGQYGGHSRRPPEILSGIRRARMPFGAHVRPEPKNGSPPGTRFVIVCDALRRASSPSWPRWPCPARC